MLVLLFSGVLPISLTLVIGSSMEPGLRSYDMVLLLSTRFAKPRVGDIVLAYINGRRVVHRLVAVNYSARGYYLTKGDNNPAPDPPTNDVRAVAILVVPRESLALTILLLALVYRRHSRRLAIYLAPLTGVVVMSVVVMTILKSGYSPLFKLFEPPRMEQVMFRTTLNYTEIVFRTNTRVNDVSCVLADALANTSWSYTAGLLRIVIKPYPNTTLHLVSLEYVPLKCIASLTYHGRGYVYSFYLRLNVPRALKLRSHYSTKHHVVILTLVKSPYSLPIVANITLTGCGTRKLITGIILSYENPVEIRWSCNDLTIVSVDAVIGGRKLTWVDVIRPEHQSK